MNNFEKRFEPNCDLVKARSNLVGPSPIICGCPECSFKRIVKRGFYLKSLEVETWKGIKIASLKSFSSLGAFAITGIKTGIYLLSFSCLFFMPSFGVQRFHGASFGGQISNEPYEEVTADQIMEQIIKQPNTPQPITVANLPAITNLSSTAASPDTNKSLITIEAPHLTNSRPLQIPPPSGLHILQ